MNGFDLPMRPAKIGGSINTRTEKHGDDDVTAMDIPLSAMILSAEEIDLVLGSKGNVAHLFVKQRTDGTLEPRWPRHAPIQFNEKFENAAVLLSLGLNQVEVQLGPVKLARVRVNPLPGGVAEFSCQVQCTPDLGPEIATLFAHLNHTCEAEISVGEPEAKSTQPELGLNPGKAA